MPYIARTDGGDSILELREGSISEIAEADRSNWRSVAETRPGVDNLTKTIGGFTLEVRSGSVYMDWQAVPLPDVSCKMRLKEYATAASRTKREAGLTLPNNVRIDTSVGSLAMIIGAVLSLERGYAQEPISFCALSGPVLLTLEDLKGVWAEIAAFTQASFAARAACFAAIDDGKITTTAQVDAAV